MFTAAAAAARDPLAIAVEVVARDDAGGEENEDVFATARGCLPGEVKDGLASVACEQFLVDGELLVLNFLFEIALSLEHRLW